MDKNYTITSRTYYEGKPEGSKSSFLTMGENIKEALSNLLTGSNDFNSIIEGEKKINITIEEEWKCH